MQIEFDQPPIFSITTSAATLSGMKTYNGLPPVFRWWDFVSFGLLGVYVFGFLIYGLIHGATALDGSKAPADWPYLMAATGLGFFFVYYRVIVIRQKEIAGFVLLGGPKYGFAVNFGDYIPAGETHEALFNLWMSTADEWVKAGWTLDQIHNALNQDYIWVWFKPEDATGGIDLPQQAGKVAGYTIYRQMVIGYKQGVPFEKTAAAHELGHVIQGTITNVWDIAIHHQRSKELGLP
jgi:hypothetical protein